MTSRWASQHKYSLKGSPRNEALQTCHRHNFSMNMLAPEAFQKLAAALFQALHAALLSPANPLNPIIRHLPRLTLQNLTVMNSKLPCPTLETSYTVL
jgi:hypothetical protein